MARPVPEIQHWDVQRPASGRPQSSDPQWGVDRAPGGQRPWAVQQQEASKGVSQPAASGQTQPDDPGAPLLIDCATCSVRGTACGDCVVTVLLGGPPAGVELAEDELQALDVLAGAGLIPPLRAAPPPAGSPPGQ